MGFSTIESGARTVIFFNNLERTHILSNHIHFYLPAKIAKLKELLQKSKNHICADCGTPDLNGPECLREHEYVTMC